MSIFNENERKKGPKSLFCSRFSILGQVPGQSLGFSPSGVFMFILENSNSALLTIRNKTVCATLAVFLSLFMRPVYSFEVFIGTDASGSFSHHVGKTLCRAIKANTGDIDCKAVITPGVVDNLTNVRSGSLDLGIVDSRMLLDAANKAGYFRFLDIDYSTLRVVLPLYDIPVSLVVRSNAGINSVSDLEGKRINIGAPRSGQRLAMKSIMSAKNWSKSDFSLVDELPVSQSQDTYALCHGNLQATLHIGVHPDRKLRQVFRLCNARLASMDDSDITRLIESNQVLTMVTLPKSLYSRISNDIRTFGLRALLVASADLDRDTVKRIVKALVTGKEKLNRSHPALSELVDSIPAKDIGGVPIHPGTLDYSASGG